MAYKDEIELSKAANLKRLRAAVRVEASIRADALLNELEDQAVREMDRRIQAGEGIGSLVDYRGWIEEAVSRAFPPALPVGDEVH